MRTVCLEAFIESFIHLRGELHLHLHLRYTTFHFEFHSAEPLLPGLTFDGGLRCRCGSGYGPVQSLSVS